MLRFVDSFDHYPTAQGGRKWKSFHASATISPGNGRHGSASYRATNINQFSYKDFDNQDTWIIGHSFRYGIATGIGRRMVFVFDSTLAAQCGWNLERSGQISIFHGITSLGMSTLALTLGVTYYIEFKVKIHHTLGTAEVRVNGETWLSLSGVDTQDGVNPYGNRIMLMDNQGGSEANTIDFDDLYVCDGQGAVNNTFLGDCRVDATLPTGDGNYSQWTPSTPPNYENVNDAAANDDTDYNRSATVAQKDTYAYPDIPPTTGVVLGVAVQLTLRKDDAGGRTTRAIIRQGGTDYPGVTRGLGEAYALFTDIFEQDPSTAAPWTLAGVNAAEYGVELVS